MPRDGQSSAYNAILAADGFQSVELFEVTLHGGATVFISDTPATVDSQPYEPDVAEGGVGELRFSEGDNVDGMPLTFQNVDGVFGATDSEGVSPLDGARAIRRRAVSAPGANDWEVDTLGVFIVRDLEDVNQAEAKFTLIPDYADPSKTMSSETVFLEELSPVAATVSGGGRITGTDAGGGTNTDPGNSRFGGIRGTGFFDYHRDPRLDRDFAVNML